MLIKVLLAIAEFGFSLEAVFTRLTGGVSWITMTLIKYSTAAEAHEQAARLQSTAEAGNQSAGSAVSDKKAAEEIANKRKLYLLSAFLVWFGCVIGGSVMWRYYSGLPISSQVVVHVGSCAVLLWLIKLKIFPAEVDAALAVFMVIGNTWYSYNVEPGATKVGLLAPLAAVFTVAWIHGPEQPHADEAIEPFTADTRQDLGSDTFRIALEKSMPTIAAATAKNVRAAEKAGKLPRSPIERIDVTRLDNGAITALILLPPGSAVEELSDDKVFAKFTGALDKPQTHVIISAHEGVQTRLKATVFPCPVNELPAPAWPHLTQREVDPEFVCVGFTEEDQRVLADVRDSSAVFAGQKNSGKSTGMRAYMAAVVLQRRTRIHIFNFKGNNDFYWFQKHGLCGVYQSDSDDAAVLAFHDFLKEYCDEARRRAALMRSHGPERFPDQTFTVADLVEFDLWSDKICVDEVNIATQHPKHGEAISLLLQEIGEKHRFVHMTMLLALQKPSAKALPKEISDQCDFKACFHVADYVTAGLVLGDKWDGPKPQLFKNSEGRPLRGVAAVKGTTGGQLCRFPNTTNAYIDPVLAAEAAARSDAGELPAGTWAVHAADAADAGVVVVDPELQPRLDVTAVWPPNISVLNGFEIAERIIEEWPERYGSLFDEIDATDRTAPSRVARRVRAYLPADEEYNAARRPRSDGGRGRSWTRDQWVTAAGDDVWDRDRDPAAHPAATRPDPEPRPGHGRVAAGSVAGSDSAETAGSQGLWPGGRVNGREPMYLTETADLEEMR